MTAPHAPFLVALPKGLTASGVTTWALRLLLALKARGHPVGLALHDAPPDQQALDADLSFIDVLADLRGAPGPLLSSTPSYARAVRTLSGRTGLPVVCSPNLLGDCYAVFASITQAAPEDLRVVGVMHADIPYDARVLEHYAPTLARFIGVSERTTAVLRARLPRRAADVVHVPHGVGAPQAPPKHEPVAGRPLRLIYTGRIEHPQKRVRALAFLSDELSRLGVPHELELIGDGPALAEMRALAAERPSLRVPGPLAPSDIDARLDRADAFVLASRYEGLSVSMLEAMARACAPIVTAVASGAGEAIDDGRSGALVEVAQDASDEDVGRALARACERFWRADPAALREGAWRTVRDRFSIDAHADAWSRLIDGAVASPARSWPLDRPCAFTAAAPGLTGGAVPPDGADRLRALLRSLAGRTIILHAAGRHTIELAGVLAESSARIAFLTDDDPARWGASLLGWTVRDPARIAEEAKRVGATDVVLSSWLHQDAMWARRAVFERAGLRVHRIYTDSTGAPAAAATRP